MTSSSYQLPEDERRRLVTEIQLDTFNNMNPEDVRFVTSWALTLSRTSDECLLRIWDGIYGDR